MYKDTIGICYGVPDPKLATRFTILVTSGLSFKELTDSSASLTVEDVRRWQDTTGEAVLGLYNLTGEARAWVVDTEDNRSGLARQPTFLVKRANETERTKTRVNPRLHMIGVEDYHRIKMTYESVSEKEYEHMTVAELADLGWRVARIEGCDSKYGRIAFNDREMLTRGLTATEFYGSVY